MKYTVKVILEDENGQVIQNQEHPLDIDGFSLDSVEEQVETFKLNSLGQLESSLLHTEQTETVKKNDGIPT